MSSLTSWTRTLNEDDAQTLLDAARPGLEIEAWRELGHAVLPQPSRARRNDQLRLVRDRLLDHDDRVIQPSRFLDLFQQGSPLRRATLLHGRYLWHQPLVHRALDNLLVPAIERADRPLAPHDAAVIPSEDWDRALRAWLRSDIPVEALRKTRTTLQKALASAGVLAIEGNTTRTTTARHGRPDPLGFAWLLAYQLHVQGLDEVDEPWAHRESFAARLFAPDVGYAATCIQAGIDAGLLRQGHLMGRARLHGGEV